MQYSVRVLAVLSTALIVQSATAQKPLYVESFALTNRFIELKDFNNAGDLLATLMQQTPGVAGENRENPAIIRGGTVINLYPTGTPNIDNVRGEGLSQVRDDGGVYVAGTAFMKDGFWRAALWNVAADGSFTFRTMPNIILPEDSSAPGEQPKSYGYAVNKAGVLVGAGDSYLASLATIWTPPYANAVRYLLSTGSAFTEIDESGLLVANGVEFDHGGANNRYAAAITFAGGVPTEIPLLELPPATLWPNDARSMSGDWVAGDARLSTGTRGFAWKKGAATSINLPNPAEVPFTEGSFMQAQSINSSGHAVGYFNGGSHSTRPILWHYDGMEHTAHFLSSLIVGEAYPDHRVEYAIEINDSHQIAFVKRDFNQSVLQVYKPLTQGFIEFAQEGLWLDEESGKAEFRLKLHRPFGNNAAMTVNFETVDGTAKAGVDYVAKSGTVTWFAGEAGEKTVTVSIINDTALRADRSFTLRLTGASQADLASQRESSCTVVDLYQSFAARNQIAVGWNYGVGVQHGQTQAIIKFERTGGTDGAITFTNFQTIGSQMKAGVDFELPNTLSVSWAAGEGGVKTVSVPLLNTDVAITEPKLFTISADGTYEGTTMVNSLAATVVVVPPGMEVPPVVDTARLQRILENFSFSVSTLQGAMVELEKSLNGLTSWVTAAEARADDGEVQFNAPLSTSDNAGFFRIKVKP